MALSAHDLLKHMREAAEQALTYTEDMERDDFLGDKRTQQAVILNLVIIGEAATKLMDQHAELTDAHRHIEWRAIRGMRNRIAHGYYDINLDIVWETLCSALPILLDQLNGLSE